MRKKFFLISLCLVCLMLLVAGCDTDVADDMEADDTGETDVGEVDDADAVDDAAVADEYGENVIVSVCDPWPPFVDEDSPTQGISMEIIRAAYATQGYEVVQEFMPWARAEEGVINGDYDILPDVWFTEERGEQMMFSDHYVVNEVKFIKKKGDPFEYDGLESLDGKIVATMRGYGYGDDFLNADNFERAEGDDMIQNINRVTAELVDLTIEDEIVASARMAADEPGLLDEVEFTENALSSNPLYISAGYNNPRHEEIITAFNNGLEAIKEDGTYEEILARYGIE